jgi:uncharacterized repeat protein (TIGR02543 family)
VIFISNGAEYDTKKVAQGTAVNKPADPTREGYTFDGWYEGSTVWNFSDAVTADLTLTAKWTHDAIQGTDSYLIALSANGNDIEVEYLEYLAGCGETEVVLDIEVSPYAAYTIDNAVYTRQAIPLTGDVTRVNIRVVSETGESEKNYVLKIMKAVMSNKLYFQRWSDVLAINNNPANNGGFNVEGVRWYRTGSHTIISTAGYIPIQGSASDYYAEIQLSGEWHRVCGTIETRSISGVTIYPNPIPRGETAKVKLSEDFVGGYLDIYSITGLLVKSNLPLPTSNNSITVQDLSTGIYLFKVINKTGNSETVKIIIE